MMEDDILAISLTGLIFGIFALTVIYMQAVPNGTNGNAPFAIILENGGMR